MTQIAGWFIAAVVLAALFRLGIYAPYKRQRDGAWRPTAEGQMRRMSREGWQYRKMSPGEILAAKDDYDAKQY